jgi:fibronectin type 3 domain-containing protein
LLGVLAIGCTTRKTGDNDDRPSLIRASYSSGKIALAWDYTTTEEYDGFYVHRSVGDALSFTLLTESVITATTYTDSAISIGNTYYYKVSVVSDNVEISTSTVMGVLAAAG